MKTPLKLLLALVCSSLLVASCSKKQTQNTADSSSSSSSIRLNITGEPQTLDPRKARALADFNLILMFNEGLTRVDKEGKTALGLAKEVKVSDDQLTYTFTLKDAKWSNGENITSHDFAHSWKKSLSPSFNSANAYHLFVIKNAKDVKTGKLPTSLLGIETPNDNTLVVHLNHPVPYFLEMVEHPIFFPVNEKVDRQHPNWAENQATHVSCGPFRMEEWKHHNLIKAAPNSNYWDARNVKLSSLTMYMVDEVTGFKMFDSHELEWDGSPFSNIPLDSIDVLKQEDRLESAPVLGTQWIRINIEKFPFKSKKIRRAFAFALNRRDIVDHVTQGDQIPATGIVPAAMGLQDKPYFQDGQMELATDLFEEGLSELKVKKEQIPEIILTYAAGDRSQAVAQAIQQQWYAAFGIRVRLEPVESKVYFSRIAQQDYTLAIGSWFADYNDAINFLEVFKTKANGTNNTNWENPGYGELIETSYACSDPEERRAYLKQTEELIMDEMPVIPIFYYTLLYVKDHNVEDVVLTQTGLIDFKWAHLNK